MKSLTLMAVLFIFTTLYSEDSVEVERDSSSIELGSSYLLLGLHPSYAREFKGFGLSTVFEQEILDYLSAGAEMVVFKKKSSGLRLFTGLRTTFHPFGLESVDLDISEKLDIYGGLSLGGFIGGGRRMGFSIPIGLKFFVNNDFGIWFEADWYGLDIGVVRRF